MENKFKVWNYVWTFVKVNNQEDIDKAVKFYESKWYKKHTYTESWNYDKDYDKVHLFENKDIHYWGYQYDYLKDDITDDVLWTKYITATEAYISKWLKSEDIQHYTPSRPYWTSIAVPTKKLINEIYGLDPILTINEPTKMNKVRTTIWDRFFKKTESKVIDLIENTEENVSRLNKVIDYFDNLDSDIRQTIRNIENDIERNDKENLSKHYDELKSFSKELEDDLMEQFITIGEKILSSNKK